MWSLQPLQPTRRTRGATKRATCNPPISRRHASSGIGARIQEPPMSAVAHPPSAGHADHDHAHDHPHGWRRWLFATNHKDIGTMYLWFSFTMFIIGGLLALGIRLEL